MFDSRWLPRVSGSLWQTALILSALGTLLGGACTAPEYDALGENALDDASVDGESVFAHIASALDSEPDTVEDIMALTSEDATFSGAPDPSALLADIYNDHAALPTLGDDALRLRVLVQNVGLLERRYIQGVVSVPEVEARRAQWADILIADDWDIMLLTEVWELSDVEVLEQKGADAGYLVWGGSDALHPQTGVVVAVKNDIIAENSIIDLREHQFVAQYGLEEFPGPGLKRGLAGISFDLEGTSQRIHLLSTHFTSFIEQWPMRTAQARELGIMIRDELDEDDIVLVGGDFNAAPYYPRDTWTDGAGEDHKEWWANTIMYPAVLHYGDLTDAQAAATPSNEVEVWDIVPEDGVAALLDEPLGDESRCDDLVPGFFTAIDCNALHFEAYAGTEYPQRLDYLFFRDGGNKLRVEESSMAYFEPIDFGERTMELSDHYGVGTTLRVARD